MLSSQRALRDLPALRDLIDGEVVTPADDRWDDARRPWNLAHDQRPELVAFPESAEDVVAIVQYASRNGLRVAPQGTGHNAGSLGSLDDTILLSTSRMRGVSVDAEARSARVAAGTLWIEVTEVASELGLAPLSGSSPDVGVVGYSLGGGVSWLGRKHGLSANSILAIELVTADGRLRRVDADNEPELFWALRGGGGSFGVVTAMEIALYPHAEIYAGAMWWPWERSADVLHRWREWTETAPEEATTSIRIMQMPPMEEVPEFLRGRSFVTIDGAVIGDRAHGAEVIAALRDLGPEIDTLRHGAAGGPLPDPRRPGGADAGAHRAPPPARPAGRGGRRVPRRSPARTRAPACMMAEIRHLGGALGRVEPGHGALGKLDADYLFFGGGPAFSPEMVAGLRAELPRFKAAMAAWDAGTGYLNFEETTVDSRSFYDEVSHRRLSRLKARYDAGDLFRSNHPIKPGH